MPSTPTPPAVDRAAPDPVTDPTARRLPVALRRPRLVLWLAVLFLVLTGALAGGASGAMKNGGFDDPASDSSRAAQLLAADFPAGQSNLVLLVQDLGGSADAPEAVAAGRHALAVLAAQPGVHVVDSYYAGGDPALRSTDGHSALTTVNVSGDEDTVARATTRLHDALARTGGPVTVRFGGVAQVTNDLTQQTDNDLALSEGIALPLTLILLFFVFRGVLAALLPLFVGVLSISGALAVLYGLGQVTSVSVFAVNLTTALGLGLSVDYSLLIVSRYREERAAGLAGPQALAVTLRTAGRTVVFSGAIVAAVLATLVVFKQYFLSSFAYAGVAVVAITVACALLPLPAALLLVGDRIDRWAFRPRRQNPPGPAETRLWGRIAGATMRRPLLAGALVVGLLAVMAWPLTGAQFGVPDERALPKGSESRVVADLARAGFPGDADNAVTLVSAHWPGAAADPELASYAARLSAVAHVTSVTCAAGSFEHGRQVAPPAQGAAFTAGTATLLRVDDDVVAYSPAGERLVHAVRAVTVPAGRVVLVGGLAAQYVDVTASIGDRLPLALTLAALLTLVLLGLATGSVLLPVKAVLFNALGLGAVLGAMVWVFQDGHLAGLLDVTPAPIAVTMPVLLLCVAYALSMDYEMFVLSRIKERYGRTGDPYLSVREGLGGSGPVITAAAAILAVSFFSTAISGVSLAKLFGIGTGLAVILDALLVRGVLVPAFLRLTGPAAWWAPAPMRRLARRFSGAVGEH
ncbi:RND superfamily putative drug exporter [Streptacidiphilus sp. MAP12-33]|uniref:MMPL family transporter n=1 Tax=Streptacidiphilus sp. MAP12-33 TaxID=3156266 RepID=UPI003514614F